MGAIKSDGGSSSYYDLHLPVELIEFISDHGYVKTEQLIEHCFSNDFDFGNIFKSLVRAHSASNGEGKEGNSIPYEMNKISYSSNKIKERYSA